MTLKEMREILAARDLQLTKSLGQNFLHDGNQLRRIVAAAELAPNDHVLEIGPGLGPLTELLLASGAPARAIEKDERLVRFLRERWADERRLTLLHDDALAYLQRPDADTLFADWPTWKLVANLPYSVASPILVELALHPRGPERMVVTLQLEVARRIAAASGFTPVQYCTPMTPWFTNMPRPSSVRQPRAAASRSSRVCGGLKTTSASSCMGSTTFIASTPSGAIAMLKSWMRTRATIQS